MRVVGSSPKAAVYAGIKSDVYDRLCLRIIWLTLLISGELAGLGGVCKVLGAIGQLNPAFILVTVTLPSLLLLLAG